MINWQDNPYAPEPETKIANVNEVLENGAKEVIFGEGKDALRFLLLRIDDTVKTYLNRCPHYGVPLNVRPDDFLVMPDQHIMCAVHCALFRFSDGECVDGPAKGYHLQQVETKIAKDGAIILLAVK